MGKVASTIPSWGLVMNRTIKVIAFFLATLLPSCACTPSPLEDAVVVSGEDVTTTIPTVYPLGVEAWDFTPTPPTTLPPPTTTTTTAVVVVTTTSPPQPTGDIWWELAGCETGYTYNMSIHNPTGKYHGAFQFDIPTWQSVGGPGDPHEHDYSTQLHYAKILQSQRGWSPWPHCARTLGLL